jgi:pilus assembly protein Flp/PilA
MIRTPEGPKTMCKFSRLTMITPVLRFMRDESGATAIEYALVASGIAVAIASTVVSLGSAVKNNLYGNVATALK